MREAKGLLILRRDSLRLSHKPARRSAETGKNKKRRSLDQERPRSAGNPLFSNSSDFNRAEAFAVIGEDEQTYSTRPTAARIIPSQLIRGFRVEDSVNELRSSNPVATFAASGEDGPSPHRGPAVRPALTPCHSRRRRRRLRALSRDQGGHRLFNGSSSPRPHSSPTAGHPRPGWRGRIRPA
jgi:hypothetical protein